MTKFLVVFDVDSTLIEDEVIELLADVAGKRAEVAAVTERAMAGELDFAESLIERVKTLAGLPESVFEEVLGRIRITTGAKTLIDAVHAAGGQVGAVSGGFNQLLGPLAKTLELDFARANQLEVADGVLTGRVIGKIIDRAAKAESLLEWAEEAGFAIENTVAVGDGANDLDMLAAAGLGVGFNCKPIVREHADYVLEGNDLSGLIPVLKL
ncbi:phosphoserine phosphatase SerB [Rhodoluna limnophila]|uniref:phosphoserine phosphatase SerB n=1 Tax=Rhodoluna limnophila TaxID=232537 RepID=UPI0011059C12|nr:phosphoserine phosphatase SerB [Rhodoluna limnophila]